MMLRLTTLLLTTLFCANALAQPSEAQKGLDGWLVYTSKGGNLDDYIRANIPPRVELDAMAIQASAAEAALQKRDITFLWVTPPDTTTIYPESVPPRYKRVAEKSRLELLDEAVVSKGFSGFDDLTAVLRAAKAKSTSPLYKKTDTHWTDTGAFIAYREIIAKMAAKRPDLSKKLVPVSLDAYTLRKMPGFSGDLAGMLGLKGELTEDLLILAPKSSRSAAIAGALATALDADRSFVAHPAPGVDIKLVRTGVVTVDNATRCPGPSLVLYHDSFAMALAPWFAESFCKTSFFFTSYYGKTAYADKAWVVTTSPTFVVLETLERFAVHEFPRSVLSELSIPDSPVPQPAR